MRETRGVQRNAEKKRQPFFSVVIPTHNRRKRVSRAIKSVLRQSCKDFEVIVVDDGSKDGTRRKIRRKFGSKVRYFYQSKSGPSAARNKGIKHARGKYIAFLDSDDVFLRHKLKHNKRYLRKHPNCKFLYSWYYDIPVGRKRKRKLKKPRSYKSLNRFRHSLYRRKFTIRTSTVVVHQRCFQRVGRFNRKYRYSQDWDMWLRLAKHYLGHCQRKPLVKYYRYKKKRSPHKIRRYHRKIKRYIRSVYRWKKNKIKRLDRKYGR